ncbi:hypothetical protein [Streptomyces sp. NPDC006510]|uniref:hypothetical protein n=1 Tax=Streptomyces sp. NPDC006510 TaxID=3155600 RepID=UPI0033B36137
MTFTRDDREIQVFCTWYQHAPLVEIEESWGFPVPESAEQADSRTRPDIRSAASDTT